MAKTNFVSKLINIGTALTCIIPYYFFAESATAKTKTKTICGFNKVPSGYVAVGYRYSRGCDIYNTGKVTTNNATVITTPHSGQTICGLNTKVPSGYVGVGYRYLTACDIYNTGKVTTNNATVIRTPRSGQTICGLNTKVPSGYVGVGYRYLTACDIYNTGKVTTNNATVIRTLR